MDMVPKSTIQRVNENKDNSDVNTYLEAAYQRACKDGYDEVFLARLNLIGFHEAGKTSLAKRLLGDHFDINEESTEGITLYYIESNFNKDTAEGESWMKSKITPEKIHKQVKAKTASELEIWETVSSDFHGKGQHAGDNYLRNSVTDQSTDNDDQKTDQSRGNDDQKTDDGNKLCKNEVLPKEQPTTSEKAAEEQKMYQPSIKSKTINKRLHEELEECQIKAPTRNINMRNPYNYGQILASVEKSSASKENTPFTLRLWDLGGQNDFITTHHLFLDVQATTLIVMDITKEFDKPFRIWERDQNKEKNLRLKRTNPKTPAHILHYWLNTFFVEAKDKIKDRDENDFELNIAIVLTHIDEIKEAEQNEYVQEYKYKILKSFGGRPYEHMVKGIKFFEVDNRNGSEKDFQDLRNKLFQMFKKQNSWGYKMPTRWMGLQAKLLEGSEKIMNLSILKEEAMNFGFDDVEVESFLKLHNSIGNLLYFDSTTQLKGNIITDPNWLVEKCKEVITHPEFIDKRKLEVEDKMKTQHTPHQQSKIGLSVSSRMRPGFLTEFFGKRKRKEEIQKLQETLDDLKRGLITDEGLDILWKGDEVVFLTKLMLNFDLFLQMNESAEFNQQYLIPCMLPNEENHNGSEEKQRVYLYDALQEAECGDWFKIGEFDKLLAVFARLPGWKLSRNPPPSYGCAHFEYTQQTLYVQLSLQDKRTYDVTELDNPLFRVEMYYTANTLNDAKDVFRSFTHLIGELRKVKKILHDRMGVINIKQAKKFKVLCPNYDPDHDEYSTLIDAEEENDGIIRVPEGYEGCCTQHKKPLPSDQYTWLIQNVLLNKEEQEKIQGFDAALLSGKADILRGRNSQVSIQTPGGMQDILCRKIHTDLSRNDVNLPDDESLIGPSVEVHLAHLFGGNEEDQGQFLIKIPHCLETHQELLTVKVRCIDDKKKDAFHEMSTRGQAKGKIPYFEIDSSHVIIHTNHFSEYVCSSSDDACLRYIMAFPFGNVIQKKEDNISDVQVIVYLCTPLYKIQDFKTNLEQDLEKRERFLITEMNIPLPVPPTDFDAENSTIAIGLTVTDKHKWEPTKPEDARWNKENAFTLCDRLLLSSVMDIHKCKGPCEKHYARSACEFNLRVQKLRRSFSGSLDVKLFAATTTEGSKKVVIEKEIPSAGLDIYERASEKATKVTSNSAIASEKNKKDLTAGKMLKLSKQITKESELNCLAILGLGIDDKVVDKHIKNNKEFNMAVYGVLKEWRSSKEDGQDAFQVLYEALGSDDVDMKDCRKALE